VVACQPSSLSRSGTARRAPAARLDGVELALDHAVAMKVDLAFCGLGEAKAALAVDHANRGRASRAPDPICVTRVLLPSSGMRARSLCPPTLESPPGRSKQPTAVPAGADHCHGWSVASRLSAQRRAGRVALPACDPHPALMIVARRARGRFDLQQVGPRIRQSATGVSAPEEAWLLRGRGVGQGCSMSASTPRPARSRKRSTLGSHTSGSCGWHRWRRTSWRRSLRGNRSGADAGEVGAAAAGELDGAAPTCPQRTRLSTSGAGVRPACGS
jgi:hypothetical protein